MKRVHFSGPIHRRQTYASAGRQKNKLSQTFSNRRTTKSAAAHVADRKITYILISVSDLLLTRRHTTHYTPVTHARNEQPASGGFTSPKTLLCQRFLEILLCIY